MKLSDIVFMVNGRVLYGSDEILEREYSYAVASDLMSNVMLDTEDDSILITGLVNPQVIRASEMMNITCIIVTCGRPVTDQMIELASNRNIALIVTDDTTFTVCGKLHSSGIREGNISQGNDHFTSIDLDSERCIGCTHCARTCPTEAIRIRNGKAVINAERCIECGICVKVCPRHAASPVVDSLDAMEMYDHSIAIPSSAFFGQFRNVRSRNHLLTALKRVGFDEVYEEAIGAEMISYSVRKLLGKGERKLPLISAGCPSVLNLIQIRFPNLMEHVVDYRPPAEIVASLARREAERRFPEKKIGIFFITPCTANISSMRETGEAVDSDIDEMVAISDIYVQVLSNLKEIGDDEVEDLERAGMTGLRWASPGGESLALDTDNFVAIDGIDKIIDIFEKIEDEKLEGLDFIETEACVGGCCGGSLTVENSYSAKANIKKILDEAKEKYGNRILNIPGKDDDLAMHRPLRFRPVMQLDEDLNVSLKKMEEMGRIMKTLPGIDCGVCGAPTCRAFAEDIVRGMCTGRECILRKRNART